jgi:hypothetical protein
MKENREDRDKRRELREKRKNEGRSRIGLAKFSEEVIKQKLKKSVSPVLSPKKFSPRQSVISPKKNKIMKTSSQTSLNEDLNIPIIPNSDEKPVPFTMDWKKMFDIETVMGEQKKKRKEQMKQTKAQSVDLNKKKTEELAKLKAVQKQSL